MGSGYERYQGVEKHSSGFKLLSAMGWKEGEGLGAKGQGLKEHIKVRRRQDSSGIGLAEATKKSRDWTIGMVAFDQVLAKLSNISAVQEEPRKKRKRKDADAEDPAIASQEAGAVAPEVEAARSSGKTKKKKSSPAADAAVTTEAAAASIEDVQAKSESEEQKGTGKSRHSARFARRRAGKNVRGYSGSDLAAILGGGARSTESPGPSDSKDAATSPVMPSMGTTFAAEEAPEAQESCELHQDADIPEEKRWWHGYFTPAGRLGSIAPPRTSSSAALAPQVKINGFSEQDQENLYHLAHDKSGKGRQGLGIASRPKKVAGARWQGKKTAIEDSDGEEEAEGEAAAPADSEDCSDDTRVSSEEPGSASAADSQKQPSAAADQKSLKRQAMLIMKAASGGGVTMKKLEKRVLDALGLPRKSAERTTARGLLRRAVDASSKISMQEGLLVLKK